MLVKQGKIRYVFTSSHTAGGYYSFMPELLTGLQKIYILKGSAGAGKSSFLRILGQSMAERGYEVEVWLSALNPLNPEGVYLPQMEAAVVNGSLPITIDPPYPVGKAEIINLEDCRDKRGLAGIRGEILELAQKVEKQHSKAYNILKGLVNSREEIRKQNACRFDNKRFRQVLFTLEAHLAKDKVKERHYFANAMTADGIISYVEELSAPCRKRYLFKGPEGCGKPAMIGELARMAAEKGYYLEYYHSGLEPGRLLMVLINSYQAALIDTGGMEFKRQPGDVLVDLEECINDNERGYMETDNSQLYRHQEAMLLQVQEALEEACLAVKRIKRMQASYTDYESVAKKRKEIERELGIGFPGQTGEGVARDRAPLP